MDIDQSASAREHFFSDVLRRQSNDDARRLPGDSAKPGAAVRSHVQYEIDEFKLNVKQVEWSQDRFDE